MRTFIACSYHTSDDLDLIVQPLFFRNIFKNEMEIFATITNRDIREEKNAF